MDNNDYSNIQEIKYVNEYRKISDIFKFKSLGHKSYLDKLILQTFVCLILITMLLLVSNINTLYTNFIAQSIKETISWNMDLSSAIDTFSDLKNIIPNAKSSFGSLANSEKEESFILPTKGTITSEFGLRIHPISNEEKMHYGIDLSASIGTPILASIGGTVKQTGEDEVNGKFIKITSGDIETVYAHCNKIYVEEKQLIKQGDIIAEVGNTGISSGPHLHFEIWQKDEAVNPLERIKIVDN